jgi:hypothetical protein
MGQIMNLQDLLGGTMFAQNGGSGSLMANLLGGQSRPYGVQGLMQQASDPGAMATQPPAQPPLGIQSMIPPRQPWDEQPRPLPTDPLDGMGQPNIPMSPMLAMAGAANAAPVHHGIDWRRILGAVSDGFSVAGGHDPLYYQAQQQSAKEASEYANVLARAIADRDNKHAELMDKLANPEPTGDVKNYLYRQKLPQDQQIAFDTQVANDRPHYGADPSQGGAIINYGTPHATGLPAGTVYNGRRYTGQGDPQDPASWVPVTGGAGPGGPPTFR